MPVLVHCSNPDCRQEYRVKEEVLGRSGKCKACGVTFVAQSAEALADGAREVSLSMLKDNPPAAASPPPPVAKPPATVPHQTPASANGSIGMIGRFEVRQRLGAGAFGTVYLAYDPQLQREVAIKVPQRSVLNDPKRVERFLREARSAAKLRHPNIVPVYDAGQSGRQLYIASAFVQGEPLSEIVDDGGIDLKKAAKIVRALAEGLAYAHQEGVVHRDVKPANVMLDDLGQPLLMDFGLAAQVDSTEDFHLPEQEADAPESHDASRLTRAGAVMGTPSYIAPEIAGGLKGEAKPASDQYSLGVVLYELLTGRTPFEGPSAAVLQQAIHDAPPSPKEFRKDLPPDLETICLKAIAKDPADRYVTTYAMAEDLRRWMEGEPIRARRLGFVERARRWMKKEPKLAMLSGGMAVAVVAIIGLLALLWMQSNTERDAFAADRDRTARERDDSEARRKTDQDAADKALADQRARGLADLAGEKLAAGENGAAFTLLHQVPAGNRGAAWPFQVAQAEGIPEFRRVLPTPMSLALVFQLDSRHLLQVTNSLYPGHLLVWDVWTGRTVRRLPLHRDGMRIQSAAMSADGKRIATALVLDDNRPRPQLAPGAEDPPSPPPEIVIWDEQGKVVRTLPSVEGNMRIALSHDGTLLAVAGSPGAEQKLSLWTVDTGERLPAMDKALASVPFPLGPITFSPDGKLLATTTVQEKGEIRAWEIATGGEKFVIKDRGGDITHLAFSPDSTRLAAAGGAELEGPEYTTERTHYETQQRAQKVEIDGVTKDVTTSYGVSKLVKNQHVGYRNPKMKTVFVPVCKVEKRMRMETKQVSETVNKTVEVKVPVKTLQDGKEVTTYKTETRTVPYQVTKEVNVPVWYTVNVTTMQSVMMTDTDPVVRVWGMDGALQTKIVEAAPVTALAWRDDSALLATACDRNDPCNSPVDCNSISCGMPTGDRADVRFWEPATGKLVFALPCSTQQVAIVAFSPDRKHIAAAAGMGITLWSTESRSLLANLRGDGPIASLLFSPDNLVLSSYSKCNQSTRLWDVPSSRQTARLAATGPFMQFLPSSRFLAGQQQAAPGYSHGYHNVPSSPSLGRWLARDGAAEKHPGGQSSVLAYSADGSRFVSGQPSMGKGLALFDGQTGVSVCDLADSIALGAVRKLQVSRDGSRVVALAGNEAVLWDGASGKVLARKWNAGQADLSSDGKRWAVATQPNAGYFDGPKVAPAQPATPVPDPKKGPIGAAPAKPGLQAGANAEDDSSFVVQKVEPAPQPKPPPKVVPKAPLQDGPPPVIAPPQSTVTLFDGDGKELAKLHTDYTSSYSSLAFDPTGKFLIGVGDNTWVRVWNVTTGKLIAQHITDDPNVAISPDGRFLAFLSEQPIMAPPAPKAMPKVVPAPAPTEKADAGLPPAFVVMQGSVQLPQPAPPPLPPSAWPTYAPYGAAMPMQQPDQARPGDRQSIWVMVVELATGKLIWQSNVLGTDIGGMAFSADGKRLALGFVDEEVKNDRRGYVQVWDTAAPEGGQTFKSQGVARYSGHLGAVNAVAFSPDGKLLASGGDDRIVKVWKLPAEGEQGPGGDIPIGFPVVASPGAPMMVPPAPVPVIPPAPAPSPGK